ncbi:MAG: CoA pyrophosphatase [SAR324 cluster bacterium]|nr:CoA pyrophosphatase [SAR324 cluster bacterium]
MPTLDDIKSALARHEPRSQPFRAVPEQAAVAMILAGEEDALRLCMIRRAEREGDPWSGHYAFPGGRAQPEDPHARAVAERETGEEVGLRLEDRHLLGALSEMPIRLGGRDTGMRLSTFVYHLGRALPPFTPNNEVAAAYWVPLSHLWDAGNATHLDLHRSGARMVYPAIQYLDYVIWGLTFRVLTLFSDILDRPLPHLEEIPGLGR